MTHVIYDKIDFSLYINSNLLPITYNSLPTNTSHIHTILILYHFQYSSYKHIPHIYNSHPKSLTILIPRTRSHTHIVSIPSPTTFSL